MARRIEQDLIQLRSLSGFVHRSLAVFVSIIFLLEPVFAKPRRYPVKTAQQPGANSQDGNRATAKRVLAEGDQLFKQGTAESLQRAIKKYEEALQLWRAVGDRSRQALALTAIGRVYSKLGSNQQALDYYNQGLLLTRAVRDRVGEATILNNIGLAYSDLGKNQKALEYYNQALPLSRAVGYRVGEASILHGIGLVYSNLSENQKALEYYNQALPLRHAVGDRSGEANTLNQLGTVYNELGENQKALDYYNQALPLTRAVGNRSEEATTLNGIGAVYSDLGENQIALKYYNQALPLTRAVGDRIGEVETLNNIGLVYSGLGSKQQALDYYNQVLLLLRAIGDRSREAIALNNIGAVYSALGSPQQALKYYNQALSLYRAVGYRSGEATTLHNIGLIYYELHENQKALDYYNQVLPVFRDVGDRSGEGLTLNHIGKVYNDLGENQKALDYYNQALPVLRAVGDRSSEANTLFNLAVTESNRGNLNEALTQIEAAIKIIEDLRTKVASQELRTSYFALVHDYYEFYIYLLMQLHKQQPSKGYDALALHASERARARSLLELLTEARADIRQGVEPKLLEQERTLLSQLNAIEKRRIQLLSGNHTESQAAALEKENSALLAQYQEVETQIRVKSPRYAALTQPQPLTLAEIQQQVLDDNTLLLEYSLGRERSYLWAVTKTGMTSYELPKGADIEAAAQNFRKLLTANRYEFVKRELSAAAGSLSQMLLEQVSQQLGQKRLLLVSDGALQYVPFAALPVPTLAKAASIASPAASPTPLLVEHELVSLPSASTLAVLKRELKGRKPALKTVAVFADPVFRSDDERVKKTALSTGKQTGNPETTSSDMPLEVQALERSAKESGVTFKRLKGTRQEAEQILKLVPANARLQKFDFAASRATATSPDLAQYRIVHFATHGILNSVNPEFSGLVLSLVDEKGVPENGFLRLHDIFNLNLPAELVVLSACKTGLGQDVKGEGLVGLTRGFMYAGAPRVVVSLWSVDDLATALLMSKFYSAMLQKGLQPAAALRAAQIETWKQQQWQAPYYWAAFEFQGEWR